MNTFKNGLSQSRRLLTPLMIGILTCIAITGKTQSINDINEAYRLYYEDKNYEEAAETYSALAEQNPLNYFYDIRAGYSYYHLEKYEKAIDYLIRGIRYAPWKDTYALQVAYCYAAQKDVDNTIKWIKKAIDYGWPHFIRFYEDERFDFLRSEKEFKEILGILPIDNPNRVQKWQADLNFIYRRLMEGHISPFNTTGKETWEAEYKRIISVIPDKKDHQVIVEFMKFAALAGEGHTKLIHPVSGENAFHNLKLVFEEFRDSIFISYAHKDNQNIVGAKVLEIGGIPITDLLDQVSIYRGNDNEMFQRDRGLIFLACTEILEDLGAAKNLESANLTIKTSNGQIKKVKVGVTTVQLAEQYLTKPEEWIPMYKTPPLYLSRPKENLWFHHIEKDGEDILFVKIDAIYNPPEFSFEKFLDSTFTYLESEKIKTLIVDIRNCGGVNSYLNIHLISKILKSKTINTKGSLFIVVGRETYSAAMNLASDLEYRTEAVFIGEPTGSSPNFIGESTWSLTPYSKLQIRVSNRLHQGGANNTRDKRPWIAPDIYAIPTSNEFRKGIDPVVTQIIDYLKDK